MIEEGFLQNIPNDVDDEGKHGALTNIFSCWNSMVGTGLATIPWAYYKSGIVLGVLLTIFAFIVSFTTQYMIMKTAGTDMDYTDTLRKTFGRNGWNIGMVTFVIMLFIPIILYVGFLAQFLFPILTVIIEVATGVDKPDSFINDRSVNFSEFSYSWTVVIVFCFLMLLTAKKDMAIFIKAATYGVVFTFMIIIFIVSVGIYGIS